VKKALAVMLFRMWAAGAVCFFGAWGRADFFEGNSQEAGNLFSFNLIAGLIAIMIICDLLIVNPMIRLASGMRAFQDREKKGVTLFISGLFHILKVTGIMLIVVVTYYFLNVFFIHILSLDEKSVPVPLEPLLFGILYGLYYLLFDIAGKLFLRGYPKRIFTTELHGVSQREIPKIF
jgi:hypothetical protein